MPKTTYNIEPLDKDNYDTWAIEAEALLNKNKLWKYVNNTPPEASSKEIDGDREAKSELILLIAPSQLKKIKKCTTAKALWDTVKGIHAGKGPARKANLLKRFILARLEDNDITWPPN